MSDSKTDRLTNILLKGEEATESEKVEFNSWVHSPENRNWLLQLHDPKWFMNELLDYNSIDTEEGLMKINKRIDENESSRSSL